MDRFSKIELNNSNYSNFGEDMYGVKVKIPVHSQRSLYSKQPIYFTDYGSPYGYPPYGGYGGYGGGWRNRYYAKPPSGGIWAVDGKAESVGEPAPPSASSAKGISTVATPLIIGGIVGAIAGFFVAKANKQNLLAGALIGGGAIAGISVLLTPSPEEKKMNASGRTPSKKPSPKKQIKTCIGQYFDCMAEGGQQKTCWGYWQDCDAGIYYTMNVSGETRNGVSGRYAKIKTVYDM